MKKKQKPVYVDDKELRKRRRERIIIVVAGLLAVALTLIASHYSQKGDLPVSTNILVYSLTSINVILIILLLFLIVRNVVKLLYEQRRGVIGSKLRTKLVVAFVGLSLVPTIVLFLFAINFLTYSIEFWFNIKIGDALSRSLEVAQVYYQQTAEHAKFNARQISADITQNHLYDPERLEYLKDLINQRQKNNKLGMVDISFDFHKNSIVFSDAEHPELLPITLPPKMIEDIYLGKEASTIHPTGAGDAVVGIVPVFSYSVPTEVIGRVSVSYNIPKGFVDKLKIIGAASEQYGQIKLMKNPIKFNYIVTLSIITLLIIFLATLFGFALAKEITVPIQNLAEATHKITQGNLDINIGIEADDEIGVLVKSFNQMTRDLKKSKDGLEQRRKYMETVLRNVSAGIISVDRDGAITTVNSAAEKMFDIEAEKVLMKNYRDLLIPEHIALLDEFLREMRENDASSLEKQIELMFKDKALTVLLTITTIRDEEGNYSGLARRRLARSCPPHGARDQESAYAGSAFRAEITAEIRR